MPMKPTIAPTTTKQTSSGSRLALWVSKLPKYSLASNRTTVDRLKITLQDPNSTSEKLAEHIQNDPAFCLKLFAIANRQLKKRDGDIQGLIHLIGLLGFNAIEETIKQSVPPKTIPSGLAELYSASLYSAHLACELLPEKHGTKGERFFLPCLLFNAPLWLMWCAAPKIMEHGQHLASEKGQPLEVLCQKKLGFSLQDLFKEARLFLSLPPLTLQALSIDFRQDMAFWARVKHSSPKQLRHWSEKDKSAKRKFYSAETGIYLINQYVLATFFDWRGKHRQRWTSLLCKHLGITEKNLKQVSLATSQSMPYPQYLNKECSPLHRLQGKHRGDHHEENERVWIMRQYLQQLRETDNLRQCLQLAIDAFSEVIAAEHCIILKNHKQRLQVALCSGFESNLSAIDLDVKECGQLFGALLTKPMAIAAEGDKLTRIGQQLPVEIRQYWQAQPCGLLSLFHRNKPYAIILCDHPDWNEERHQSFKVIGKQLSQTLKQCNIP